jgi:hypothetical protein
MVKDKAVTENTIVFTNLINNIQEYNVLEVAIDSTVVFFKISTNFH